MLIELQWFHAQSSIHYKVIDANAKLLHKLITQENCSRMYNFRFKKLNSVYLLSSMLHNTLLQEVLSGLWFSGPRIGQASYSFRGKEVLDQVSATISGARKCWAKVALLFQGQGSAGPRKRCCFQGHRSLHLHG